MTSEGPMEEKGLHWRIENKFRKKKLLILFLFGRKSESALLQRFISFEA